MSACGFGLDVTLLPTAEQIVYDGEDHSSVIVSGIARSESKPGDPPNEYQRHAIVTDEKQGTGLKLGTPDTLFSFPTPFTHLKGFRSLALS